MKRIIYLLISFLFFACQDYLSENFCEQKLFSYGGDNEFAKSFIDKAIQSSECLEQIKESIGKNSTLLWEETMFGFSGIYQLHYTIPVLNIHQQRVESCLIFEVANNGTLQFKELLNKARLNEIPVHERFLYSLKFYKLKLRGVNVPVAMYEFADRLNGSMMRVNHEFVALSRSADGEVYISMTFDIDYRRNDIKYPDRFGKLADSDIADAITNAFRLMASDMYIYGNLVKYGGGRIEFRLNSAHGNMFYSEVVYAVEAFIDYFEKCLADFFYFSIPEISYQYVVYFSDGSISGGGNSTSLPNPELGEEPNFIMPSVDLTIVDNFVPYRTSGDCMKGCKEIMSNYGFDAGSPNSVYQLKIELKA